MANWSHEEKALYAESRALKFKAREMRKKRLEEEERILREATRKRVEAERAKVDAAKKAKDDRDARIRKALLTMSDAFKAAGLRVEAPGPWDPKKPFCKLYDSKSLQWVQVYVQNNGYQWD